MTDAPATTSKPRTNGAIIVLGALIVAGFVFVLSQSKSDDGTVADAGADGMAEVMQVFDLEEDPRFKAGIPLRPMDRDIFAALKAKNLTRQQMEDLFPDRPYKVHVMGNFEQHQYLLVSIDLARDGKIEERWDLRKPPVTRDVPDDPNAGGPVRYTLSHGRWQLH